VTAFGGARQPSGVGDERADLRRAPSRAPFEVVHQWVNHFPARLVRLDTARDVAARTGVSTYLRLESSYRAASLTTTYTIRAMDGRIEARPTP
jgi:hypothetical protein